MGIFLAAIEAFPSKFHGSRKPNGSSPEGEVHGLLFGQRIMQKNGQIICNVSLAVPNQMVLDRTADSISVASRHIERTREAAELFPRYSFLGCFHSHPYPAEEFKKCFSAEPSETDQDSAISLAEDEGLEMLDLIFSLTRLKRHTCTPHQFPKPHMLHACLGNYKYTLACYRAVSSENLEHYGAVDHLICKSAGRWPPPPD